MTCSKVPLDSLVIIIHLRFHKNNKLEGRYSRYHRAASYTFPYYYHQGRLLVYPSPFTFSCQLKLESRTNITRDRTVGPKSTIMGECRYCCRDARKNAPLRFSRAHTFLSLHLCPIFGRL